VQVIGGLVYVSNVPCQYGVDIVFRRNCFYAGIPNKYVSREWGDYRVTSDNARAVKIAKYLSENRPARGAFFYGATGTGKTYLAALVAMDYVRDGYAVAFYDMPALFESIKRTFDSEESTSELLNRICESELLVLDDMGAERVTDWTSEQLYLIINRRYNANRPLVATANFDLEGLERRLGNDLNAHRIISRLKEMCVQAFFGHDDWRSSRC